jgi:hypothetical protein
MKVWSKGVRICRALTRWNWLVGVFLVAGVCVAITACSGSDSNPAGEDANGEPAQTDAAAAQAAAAAEGRIDVDAIFPPGPGRDLVLNNCTSCHVFTPIVVLRMNESEWDRSAGEHRDRVDNLTEAEFTTLYDYVKANFNPDKPVPQLPQALLDSWTSY